MERINKHGLLLFTGIIVWLTANLGPLAASGPDGLSSIVALAETQTSSPTPLFRYPIVEDSQISSYFDHDHRPQIITFYDGRSSGIENGFVFTCPTFDEISPGGGKVWVGCKLGFQDEANCPNSEELWYDNHNGVDFEYDSQWHTGAACDLGRFEDTTPPIYAPAAGVVDYVGENHPFNGNFIRLYHDLDGDGDYYNDGLRSYYLHFAYNGIAVDEGDVIVEGDLLGYGGMTGMAWTPHLHFQVERQTENGWQAVDPFGWTDGSAEDPWSVSNQLLWASKD
jgi:murein DD-endopeptidase MepM/ murein hydrolase activator NlpD